MTTSRTVTLPSGAVVAGARAGTWHMGDDPDRRAEEIAALRHGIDLGLTLIDTAEMYGSGRAEELVGEAVRRRRDDVFLVSKVLPSHADARGTVDSCHASLRRLGTDRLDLYLLHWRGPVPLEETVEALEGLVAQGTIGAWGVSNLDVDDLAELPAAAHPDTDQILYNLTRRGPEYDLIPAAANWRCRSWRTRRWSRGGCSATRRSAGWPRRTGRQPAQVALAWVLRQEDVIAIPKAGSRDHVEENAAARSLRLSADDLAALDRAFPPPERKVPLEVL